jgi:hypothetical protein
LRDPEHGRWRRRPDDQHLSRLVAGSNAAHPSQGPLRRLDARHDTAVLS